MKGRVYIDSRRLDPCPKNPKGRNRHYVISIIDGVRKPEGAFDLLRDAKALKRRIESQIADGTYGQVERGNITLAEFFVIWWASMQLRLSPGSLKQYGLSWNGRIIPFLGHYRLVDLTPEIIQQFVNSLAGLAPSYARMIFSHLSSALNAAVAQGYLVRTPCHGVILPRIRRNIKPVLEPEEIALLVDIAEGPYRALIALLGYSGVRVGEALATRWRNINFQRHELYIYEAWDTNSRIFIVPKTAAGVRTIPALSILEEELLNYRETCRNSDPNALLFPSPGDPNQPLSYQTFRGAFVRALKTVGLPEVGVHDLRHAFTSTLIASGVSIAEISNALGHSDPVVTLRVYSHRIRAGRGEGFRRADDMFKGNGDGS